MAYLMLCLTVHMLTMIVYSVTAATVNQRQTGDLNVHVNVKDFKIIALLKDSKEEYVDYDYAYDYSEMTIKPQNTTAKPLNITTTTHSNLDNVTETGAVSSVTETGAVSSVTETVVEITPLTPLKNISSLPLKETTGSSLSNSSTESVSLASSSIPDLTTSAPLHSNINATQCKKGFSVNKKGECELKLQNSNTNALLKLVKLSQKLKLRREN